MLGKMMHQPLTISALIRHAGMNHTHTEVVSVGHDGDLETGTWGSVERGAKKLASALGSLGIGPSERVATIAWNNLRHLEIYFGVSAGGMVCHTINPRLAPKILTYIINHAEDKVILVDHIFLPLVASILPDIPTVKAIILMGGRNEEALTSIPELLFYDELVAAEGDQYQWPDIDENSAASLCYTSGTTGTPKGVEFTHRSTMLHSAFCNQPDAMGISVLDVVMPVVPMFHVSAWGTPYIAAMVGCKLVLPGGQLDGASLARLIDKTQVSLALGVPTIWNGLLAGLKSIGSNATSLKRTIVGGAALAPSMIAEFKELYDVELIHAWGMTEMSPLGTINHLLQKHLTLSKEERESIRLGQGKAPFGVELRIVDDVGSTMAHNGTNRGALQTRGHWVVDTYFNAESNALTEDGWFDTGDIATIDEDGYMVIRDRAKDVIKSGGEWISSVELENIAVAHEALSSTAVIAAKHQKWGERPVLLAVKHADQNPTEAEILAFFDNKISDWQIPDKVVFLDSLPIGGTGKVLKNQLRERFDKILLNPEVGDGDRSC